MRKLATCPESDECLTPRYAVEPITPFLNKPFWNHKGTTILCPFDKEDSMFVRVLKSKEFIVKNSHKDDINFFEYDSRTLINDIDFIVSNPPFSLKDKVLAKLFELNKPFAMLMPITALGGKKRQTMFKEHGIEVLFLGDRTGFYTNGELDKIKENTQFECCYICHNVLPEKIMYATMNKKQEPYNVDIKWIND